MFLLGLTKQADITLGNLHNKTYKSHFQAKNLQKIQLLELRLDSTGSA